MWHSSVSPTREYDLAISLSGLAKSEYSPGCDWLNSGRLEGIQLFSTGVDASSVSVCFVRALLGEGIITLVMVGVPPFCDRNSALSGTFMDDCDWLSDLWYLNDPALPSL